MTATHVPQHHDENILKEKRHKVLVEFPVKHKAKVNGKEQPCVIQVEAAIAHFFKLKHHTPKIAEKKVKIHNHEKTIQYVVGHVPKRATATLFFTAPQVIPGYHKKHGGGDVPQESVSLPMGAGMQIPDIIAQVKKIKTIAYIKVNGKRIDVRLGAKPEDQ